MRRLFASLLVVALLSGAVVAEAEGNYATVASIEETEAHVDGVAAVDGRLRVHLAVRNTMAEPLRIQFVHLEVDRANHTDAASIPYNGYRRLPPGRTTMTVGIPSRQITGTLGDGETMVVSGYLEVEVYNGYRFEIPIEPTEVTL